MSKEKLFKKRKVEKNQKTTETLKTEIGNEIVVLE